MILSFSSFSFWDTKIHPLRSKKPNGSSLLAVNISKEKRNRDSGLNVAGKRLRLKIYRQVIKDKTGEDEEED